MNSLGQILSGENAIQVEARIPDEDLIKIAGAIFAALFLAIVLAQLLTSILTR